MYVFLGYNIKTVHFPRIIYTFMYKDAVAWPGAQLNHYIFHMKMHYANVNIK